MTVDQEMPACPPAYCKDIEPPKVKDFLIPKKCPGPPRGKKAEK